MYWRNWCNSVCNNGAPFCFVYSRAYWFVRSEPTSHIPVIYIFSNEKPVESADSSGFFTRPLDCVIFMFAIIKKVKRMFSTALHPSSPWRLSAAYSPHSWDVWFSKNTVLENDTTRYWRWNFGWSLRLGRTMLRIQSSSWNRMPNFISRQSSNLDLTTIVDEQNEVGKIDTNNTSN